MTSTRSLAHVLCPTCNDITLHVARVCQGCKLPNNSSGQAPAPRPRRAYGYTTVKNYSAAHAEQHRVRRAAALARANTQRGISKP